MSQYILILLWIGFISFLSNIIDSKCMTRVLTSYQPRTTPFFALLGILPLIIMVASRDMLGDTGVYVKNFLEMPDSLDGISTYMTTIKKDQMFYFCSALIHIVIGDQKFFYLAIIAIIQGGILCKVYRRYSINYFISLFLFIASTDYISWMYNGIRQFTAVVIIFAATTAILKKRWFLAIAAILFASMFHQSALLMIPVVFIVQGKAWNFKTLFFIAAVLVAVMFVGPFTSFLDNMMQETQYANMVTDWQEWEDDGTSAFRVLVYSVPTILSILGIKYIYRTNDPVINFCTNMSIISTGLYIISMFTSGIFIGRLPIYASLYNYILLPWELEHMFKKESKRFITFVMITLYLCFYMFQMTVAWNIF